MICVKCGRLGTNKFVYQKNSSCGLVKEKYILKKPHLRVRPGRLGVGSGSFQKSTAAVAWSLADVALYAQTTPIRSEIWVCLKIGYTTNYSHLVGIMIINHWVEGYTIFRHTHMSSQVSLFSRCFKRSKDSFVQTQSNTHLISTKAWAKNRWWPLGGNTTGVRRTWLHPNWKKVIAHHLTPVQAAGFWPPGALQGQPAGEFCWDMGYSKGLEIKNDLIAKSIINMMILNILTILILNLSSSSSSSSPSLPLVLACALPPWICPERHSLSQAAGCHPHLPWLRTLLGALKKLPRNYDFQPAKIGSQTTRIRIQMMKKNI